ncbi:MAG: hypothetical protein ACKVOU_08610 [Cytophagales bacterium]
MKIVLLLGLLLSMVLGFSQKVMVTETEEKADGINRKGVSILLELDESVVRKQWQKKLKELGSLKTRNGVIIIDQGNMPVVSPSPVKIVSTVQNDTKGTKVWYSIELSENQFVTSTESEKFASASKFLKDFGVALYIQDINEQIKEAEKVLASLVKDQEKTILRGENLKTAIYKNRDNRLALIEKISHIDSTYKLIQIDSAKNVANQKAIGEDVDKMKRAVDIVKNKITKVE